MACYDNAMRRVIEPGAFTFFVGASSADIRSEMTVEITGEVVAHALRGLEMTSIHVGVPDRL
jgi:hypothetical protein